MRTFSRIHSRRSIQTLIAGARGIHATRRAAVTLLLSSLIALTLGVSALGDEEEEHPQPVVANFQAFFDGIDQYSVYGEVTDCDDLEGITVTFGGVFDGYSTTTGSDGYFYLLIVHEDATGQLATAKATCNEGVDSETMSIDVY